MCSAEDKYWVGVDPGGANSFGLAFLSPSGELVSHCVSCVDEAISLVTSRPLGVGIDAPLWWSSGKSGDRSADQWIRKTYGIKSGTVQTANSLRGAALTQGAMMALRLREKYPGVAITEAHPKAVAIAMGGWNSERVVSLCNFSEMNEHERDAAVAAIAAREGFEHRWPRDLSLVRHSSELDPKSYCLQPVHYFWPE